MKKSAQKEWHPDYTVFIAENDNEFDTVTKDAGTNAFMIICPAIYKKF